MKYRAVLLSLCLALALLLPAAAAVTLSAADDANQAPIAENLTLTTYRNVAVTGQCAAVDPEGDLVTFQLAEKPARGQVELREDGSFCYTPYENKKGKDIFTYVATDSCGNRSQAATVRVSIRKQATKVSYPDMSGDANCYAALRLAERGIFTGANVGGVYCFDASAPVSREEFLTMAMTACGSPALNDIALTGFYDDGDISAWAKGYVSAAVMSGAVRGENDSQGRAVFYAANQITAAEAAVIIDRLLAMGDVAAGAAQDDIPAWAYQSVMNMQAVDVLSPADELSAPLTRGEAARMLSAMLDVLDSREENRWLW